MNSKWTVSGALFILNVFHVNVNQNIFRMKYLWRWYKIYRHLFHTNFIFDACVFHINFTPIQYVFRIKLFYMKWYYFRKNFSFEIPLKCMWDWNGFLVLFLWNSHKMNFIIIVYEVHAWLIWNPCQFHMNFPQKSTADYSIWNLYEPRYSLLNPQFRRILEKFVIGSNESCHFDNFQFS